MYVAPTYAANNDGTVVGRTAAGAQVTIKDPSTGFTRTVTADEKGNYRIPYLSVGKYIIEASKDGAVTAPATEVTVTLGNATTVNLGVKELEGVSVSATSVITAVDVTSTEISTNLSRDDLRRLPVNQNVAAVAMLAPGVVKSNAGFGGLSFGGSSVAENAVYVNGLNVTDFYNRNGFSEAPYNFYQEFQVKTAGYSVEFGRTTGGVINAVVRSGTNQFHYGAELTMEPGAWHSRADDHFYPDGTRYITSGYDRNAEMKTNVYASGPIVKDKLFFFGMYEARGENPRNTNNQGTTLTSNSSSPGFWGAKIDWHLNDTNIFELMAFSDKSKNTGSVYDFNYDTKTRGNKTNEIYTDNGGKNWALTYTSYLTNDLSAKVMYGQNKRESYTRALTDLDCNPVGTDGKIATPANTPLGCTTNTKVEKRNDVRKQARMDFEWKLSDHLLRFGYDHEQDDSDYSRFYPGPGALYYTVYKADPGSTITNPSGGGTVPPGYTGYVRARRYEIAGNFETTNSAFYLEDNWQITPNFLLNAGIRRDGFDNKDGSGKSYIKMDNMWAPRFGFSWDLKGDGTTKVYGNLGRYYLPVANVINIKQAGGLLDQRTYYAFGGWQMLTDKSGNTYAMPILGPQLGNVDTSQGNGTVGDLRSEVDRNMKQVYQDELVLGFQQAINDKWSWGVNGTYRKLHNAIDDMEISATGKCGEDGYIGWVMANPGKKVTVWGDTDCHGTMGWVTVDTAKEGWAMYRQDGVDANNDPILTYIGQRGWVNPKRSYSALEFQLDRAWDNKWSFNASYVLSWNRGNAEGPVNSDTDFDDTGRTENFDNPWVNYGGDGYLPNDRRHQFKFRGTYAITPNWQVAADLGIQSGAPITGFGVGNPYDDTAYHSYYICVDKCGFIPGEYFTGNDGKQYPVPYPSDQRVYVNSPRGKYGRTSWIYNLNASLTYLRPLGDTGQLRVKFAIYNLLNQQRAINVDQDLQTTISDGTNSAFRSGTGFQQPRYAQLTVSVDF